MYYVNFSKVLVYVQFLLPTQTWGIFCWKSIGYYPKYTVLVRDASLLRLKPLLVSHPMANQANSSGDFDHIQLWWHPVLQKSNSSMIKGLGGSPSSLFSPLRLLSNILRKHNCTFACLLKLFLSNLPAFSSSFRRLYPWIKPYKAIQCIFLVQPHILIGCPLA